MAVIVEDYFKKIELENVRKKVPASTPENSFGLPRIMNN
jgi:hypothetical protein